MRWLLSTRGRCCGSDRFPLSACSNLGVVAAAELLPPAAHRPHFASGEGWLLGDDLSARETLAGLDACAASAGVAMVLLSNSVPMNSVVRFIDPPRCSLNSVASTVNCSHPLEREREEDLIIRGKKEVLADEVSRRHPEEGSLAARNGGRCFAAPDECARWMPLYRYIRWSLAE